MKKLVILISILLICTNLTSCIARKDIAKIAGKAGKKIEAFFLRSKNQESELKEILQKRKTEEKELEAFLQKMKSQEEELEAFLQKRKAQEEELETFIQKKNRENIEPEQQTKNVVEKEFQGEDIIDIENSPAMRRSMNIIIRNSRKIDSFYQKSKSQTKNDTFNFSQSLQTHFSKGTLGKQPIEMFFENVNRNNNSYSVKGKFKTETSNDFFHGMLIINSKTTSDLCTDNETEINGIYDLYEEKGHFAGKFTACGNNTKLSKANFNGDWTKYSNGKKTLCNFGL